MLEKQGDSLSVKQIRGSLGLKKAATAKLKAELLKLIKAGKISKHGTRYQKSQEITKRTDSKLFKIILRHIVQILICWFSWMYFFFYSFNRG